MRHRLILFLTLLPLTLFAAPKWTKTATKSLVTLHAVQQTGDTLHVHAFFVDQEGSIVASFKSIRYATQAWITDVAGKRYDITRILGFSSTYDVVRLQTRGMKKSACQPLRSEAAAKGEHLYVMPGAQDEEVMMVEKAGEYAYYTLQNAASPDLAGMPVLDERGAVVAILQTPVTIANAPNYALDIRYAMSLTIRPIDANHSDLRQCAIPKQMPSDEEQATSFLYLATALPNQERLHYAEDYIRAFPHSPVGHVQKAEAEVLCGDYTAAWDTYQQALQDKEMSHSDEVLYARSRAIYNKVLQGDTVGLGNWTLDQAQTDIAQALQQQALPLYTLQQAHLYYTQKQYDEACNRFLSLTQTPMRSPDLFLYAWQCQQQLGAEAASLLALNDSAVACFPRPYPEAAAPYIYLRSNTLRDMGRLREAIADQNDYEHLMQGQQLTSEFYYQREQMEVSVRMYGPAVNDIQKAISIAPDEPLYHAESAVLLFRLNDMDGAIAACRRALELDSNFPDAYRILGICLREKGDKAGAKMQLQRAKELGDEIAAKTLEGL